jgi:hypothetical protein
VRFVRPCPSCAGNAPENASNCPRCGADLGRVPVVEVRVPTTHSDLTPRASRRCVKCDGPVSKARLDGLCSRCLKVAAEPAPARPRIRGKPGVRKGRKVAPGKSKRPTIRCGACGKIMPRDKLVRHEARMHSRSRPEPTSRQSREHGGDAAKDWRSAARAQGRKRAAKRKQDSTRPKGAVEHPDAPTPGANERRLDGAAEHWWMRRDHGQFGSHASHDDYEEDGSL